MTSLFRCFLIFAMSVGLGIESISSQATEPFVAGFDRYGRHGEIDSITAGQLLLSELNCTACHLSQDRSLAPKGGPTLRDAGTRLNASWVRRYLSSPQDVKPGTTMPNLLANHEPQQREEIAAHLTSFLMTQTAPFPTIKASGVNPVPFEFWNKGSVEHGKTLYHRVGCVACHAPDESVEVTESAGDDTLERLLNELEPEELAELGLAGAARKVRSVPQAELAAKYSRQSLTHFLLNPLQVRPGGRMPNLKLAAVEAADIAAYLQSQANPEPQSEALADVSSHESAILGVAEQGRLWFRSLGCAACHDIQEAKDEAPLKPAPVKSLAQLKLDAGDGCLQSQRLDYALDDTQVEAIKLAIAAGETLPPSASPQQQLELSLLQLNCYGCHVRDSLGGVGRFRKNYFQNVSDVDLGDEGRLPPPLTHAGRKLTPEHWKKVLLGNKGDVRPHLHIRMPLFAKPMVDPLPGLFGQVDQIDTASSEEVFGKTKGHAEIGRQLMDVGCVQCHAFGGHALPGVVGVDLREIDQRVLPSWFHAFLLDPSAWKQRTRMPTFFPEGKSQHPQLLGGDPTRQIGAMWAYLNDLGRQPLPEKIDEARSQNYELVPTEQPLVLRTFFQGVSTTAIAVGFPQGVHYVFDAESGRVALAWRGRYLDAQGTWFVRSAPPAVPLGEDVITMPPWPLLRVNDAASPATASLSEQGADASAYRFQGYRLDDQRVPTFLYQLGDLSIEDRTVPETDGLRRTLTARRRGDGDSSPRLWLTLHQGKSLRQVSPDAYANEQGLTVRLARPVGGVGMIEPQENVQLWRVPIELDEPLEMEVSYSW